MVKMIVYILILLSLGTINAVSINHQKINVKLDDRLQLITSENGQIRVILKPTHHPSPEPQRTSGFEALAEELFETQAAPTQHRPISVAESNAESGLESLKATEAKLREDEKLLEIQNALQSISRNKDITNILSDAAFDINPMAITANAVNAVNPTLPSFFAIAKNVIKTVCGQYSSLTHAQRVKAFGNFNAMSKICDERNLNDYAMASQFNNVLGMIQNQIPKVGFSL